MATTVAVTIAGRSYRMACGDGEEAHLQSLARHVDETLAALRKGFGEIGDNRLVIMAAIKVADELTEAKRRIHDLERQLASHTATRLAGDTLYHSMAEQVAVSLDAAADRVERIARGLKEAGRRAEG